MMELVDMLGLEPSAVRRAGSSPVPGMFFAENIILDDIFLFCRNVNFFEKEIENYIKI